MELTSCLLSFFFFFSSRRRHTRLVSDWSSDVCSSDLADWKPHAVSQLNGKAGMVQQSGKFQIVTESWNRVVAVPYIAYMPEKDRLLMLISCDYPHQAMVLTRSEERRVGKEGRYARATG